MACWTSKGQLSRSTNSPARAPAQLAASPSTRPTRSVTDSALAGLNLAPEPRAVLFDLLVHAARAAFARGLSSSQAASVARALAEVAAEDAAAWPRGAAASARHLSALLLARSAQRLPSAPGALSPTQAAAAMDWAARVYYARFSLYKAALSAVPAPGPLAQENVAGVERPPRPPPLAEAMLVPVAAAPARG